MDAGILGGHASRAQQDTYPPRMHDPVTNIYVSIYKNVKDETHLMSLMRKEPLWELLEHKDFVDQVFHLSGHDKLLKQLKPTSVEQLAATLAIIRPAKRYLASENWTTIMKEVWIKPTDGEYYFKKAHAVSYAMACVVHMNLICESMSS